MGRTSDARERLIKSATELISEHGYTAVGVNEICEHAGVKKGSFYHFFPSKRDLVLAAINTQGERGRRLLERAMSADLPPLEKIERAFELTYRHHAAAAQDSGRVNGCAIGNLALELSTRDEVVRLKLQQAFDVWASCFKRALDEAVDAGDIPGTDTSVLADSLVAYMEGIIMLAKANNDPELIKRLAYGSQQLGRALPTRVKSGEAVR